MEPLPNDTSNDRKFLQASTMNAFNPPPHQRTPLNWGQNYLVEGVSLLEGEYCAKRLSQRSV